MEFSNLRPVHFSEISPIVQKMALGIGVNMLVLIAGCDETRPPVPPPTSHEQPGFVPSPPGCIQPDATPPCKK